MNQNDKTPATEIAIGVTLLTKDGRKIGNGIIVGRNEAEGKWIIHTDFGGKVILTEAEINEQFELGFVHELNEWYGARASNLMRNAGYPHLARTAYRDMAEKVFREVVDAHKQEEALRLAKRDQLKKAQPKPKEKKKVKQPEQIRTKIQVTNAKREPLPETKNKEALINSYFAQKVKK